MVTQFISPSARVNSEILNQYETKEEATLRRRIERLKAEEGASASPARSSSPS